MKTLRHRIVDLHARRILPAEVDVLDGRIDAIRPLDSDASATPGVLLPGSGCLVPSGCFHETGAGILGRAAGGQRERGAR